MSALSVVDTSRGGVGGIPVAPLRDGVEKVLELVAALGEAVVDPQRIPWMGLAGDQAITLELLELVGQHLLGDPADGLNCAKRWSPSARRHMIVGFHLEPTRPITTLTPQVSSSRRSAPTIAASPHGRYAHCCAYWTGRPGS